MVSDPSGPESTVPKRLIRGIVEALDADRSQTSIDTKQAVSSGGGRKELGRRLGGVFLSAFLEAFFELFLGLTEAASQFGDLRCTEEDEHNQDDPDDLIGLKNCEHAVMLSLRPVCC